MTTAIMTTTTTAPLPLWDLTTHFGWSGWNDPKIVEEMEEWKKSCATFPTQYKGGLNSKLRDAVLDYEKLVFTHRKIESYFWMLASVETCNAELVKQKSFIESEMQKAFADHLTFFAIEVAALATDDVEKQMTPAMNKYKHYIDNIRRYKPHMLSEEVERALTVRAAFAGISTVVEYSGKQLASASFKFQGEDMPLETLLSKMTSESGEIRHEALKTLDDGLKSQYVHRFAALALNMAAGSWHIESVERKYKVGRSRKNFENEMPDAVVDSLLHAVKDRGVELSNRYYQIMKHILKSRHGLKEFTWADRNAPLPLKTGEKKYTWDEAVSIVSDGYKGFSSTMHKEFLSQVNESRIHVPVLPGKRGGAYCHQVVPGVGPFQFLNFAGTESDVTTLAHESGHAAHFSLSAAGGVFNHEPSTSLAECASIFGEMIVFRMLLARAENDEARLAMLMGKIGGIINSCVRQVSFDRFEEKVHEARKGGIIDDDEFDKFWKDVMVEFYGPEGELFDKYDHVDKLWCYVHHFQNYPFYVNSYAVADLAVGALYALYMKNAPNFEEKFLDLLRAGGSISFDDAFKPFGLETDKPDFWRESLDVHLGTLLNDAEEIANKLYPKKLSLVEKCCW